jgi:hypothetical protein
MAAIAAVAKVFRPIDKWNHFAKIAQTIEIFPAPGAGAGERRE